MMENRSVARSVAPINAACSCWRSGNGCGNNSDAALDAELAMFEEVPWRSADKWASSPRGLNNTSLTRGVNCLTTAVMLTSFSVSIPSLLWCLWTSRDWCWSSEPEDVEAEEDETEDKSVLAEELANWPNFLHKSYEITWLSLVKTTKHLLKRKSCWPLSVWFGLHLKCFAIFKDRSI